MLAQSPLTLVSSGVVCSVGLSTPAACAAIRASLDNFKETYFVDELGLPIVGAAVPSDLLGLTEHAEGWVMGGENKLSRMFAIAATECLHGAGIVDTAQTALLLLGPEDTRPGFSRDSLQRRFMNCENALGHKFHAASRTIHTGRPGLVDALACANELLASRTVHSVLIAGIDSLLNTSDINDGLANKRLLTDENSDGFIPGEAAVCVLVTGETYSRTPPQLPVLTIAGLGTAQEPESWISGKANVGRGLAQAIRQALMQASIAAHSINNRLSDCSGESFFFDEAAYAWGRVLRAPSPPGHKHRLVASSVGEIGAAAGPLMLALSLEAARKGWSAGRNSLLHLSSSGSLRTALVTIA